MFIHNLDPVLVAFGPFAIRYYGLNYALSLLVSIVIMQYIVRKYNFPKLTKEDILDYAIYAFMGIVLGARIFYIIAYNGAHYLANPLDIIAVWKGGMSFHGGMLGAIIGSYLFARKKKISFIDLTELVAIPGLLGYTTGRFTNFINGELFGRVTNVPWAVNFANERLVDGSLVFRHPSQFYQAAYAFIIVVTLFYLARYKFKSGFKLSLGITMYGVFRFIVEFFRQPDPQIGFLFTYFTLGQLFCALMVVAGVYGMYKTYGTPKRLG